MEINVTPLFAELLKIRADLNTLNSIILTEEQKKIYNEKYQENLNLLLEETQETYPEWFMENE